MRREKREQEEGIERERKEEKRVEERKEIGIDNSTAYLLMVRDCKGNFCRNHYS